MVDKVARWTVELEKARQTRKARACYETASAVMPGEIEEIMEVDNDDDPEIQAKVMRARAAVTEVPSSAKRLQISGKGQEMRQARIRRLRPSSRYRFLRRPQSLWLLRSSLRLKRKRSAESNSLQTAAVMRRRLPRAGLPRRHRIPGECNQFSVGSRPGQPLDILFQQYQ